MADENDESKEEEKEERLFEPEVEGSLEKFEAELIREEKQKTIRNLLAGFVIVIAVSGGSYFVYLNYIKPQFITVSERHADTAQKTLSELLEEPLKLPEEPLKQAPIVVKPDVEPVIKAEIAVKAGIKEEILKKTPKAKKILKKTSRKKTAKAEKTPPVKAENAVPPPKPDSRKAVSRVAPQPKPEVLDKKLFTLQIGFFQERANARRMKRKLKKLNLAPTLRNTTRRVKITTIYVGEYPFREFATRAASDLLTQGFKSEVTITGPGRYELEMGRFGSEALADGLVKSLEALQLNVRVEAKIEKMQAGVVLLKNIRGKKNLKLVQKLLRKEKINFILVGH